MQGSKHEPFYDSPAWRHMRHMVMRMDKHECVLCRARGRYSRAVIVHHVNHYDEHPELALDVWYTDSDGVERRNLISVCRKCHETVCHPERLREFTAPTTTERWD